MAQPSVKVNNLRQVRRALKDYDQGLSREFDRELREAGDIVQNEARSRFAVIDARSAAGYKTKLKGFGRVVVEQSRRRTTGKRPDFGSLQMRKALIPARAAAEPEVMKRVENMLDTLGRRKGF